MLQKVFMLLRRLRFPRFCCPGCRVRQKPTLDFFKFQVFYDEGRLLYVKETKDGSTRESSTF